MSEEDEERKPEPDTSEERASATTPEPVASLLGCVYPE